jgi:hypothetical protein
MNRRDLGENKVYYSMFLSSKYEIERSRARYDCNMRYLLVDMERRPRTESNLSSRGISQSILKHFQDTFTDIKETEIKGCQRVKTYACNSSLWTGNSPDLLEKHQILEKIPTLSDQTAGKVDLRGLTLKQCCGG